MRPRVKPQHRPRPRRRPAPDRHRASSRPARPGRLALYRRLCRGDRPAQDPCVLDTFMAATDFMAGAAAAPRACRCAQGDLRSRLASATGQRTDRSQAAFSRLSRASGSNNRAAGVDRQRGTDVRPLSLVRHRQTTRASRESVVVAELPRSHLRTGAPGPRASATGSPRAAGAPRQPRCCHHSQARAPRSGRRRAAGLPTRSQTSTPTAQPTRSTASPSCARCTWYFRAEVFSASLSSTTQAEAARRLAVVDRHFPHRTRRAPARSGDALARAAPLRRQPARPIRGSAPRVHLAELDAVAGAAARTRRDVEEVRQREVLGYDSPLIVTPLVRRGTESRVRRYRRSAPPGRTAGSRSSS